MSTHKKPSEIEPAKKASPLESLRATAFDADKGEWTGLRWVPAQQGDQFVIVGNQGTLSDEHGKPVVFDAQEAHRAVDELTKARPGDAPRAVPLS